MIREKLRYKILVGALALVLTVSCAITAVVSVLVVRQNKDAVRHSLDRTLTVVRDTVADTQNAFYEFCSWRLCMFIKSCKLYNHNKIISRFSRIRGNGMN